MLKKLFKGLCIFSVLMMVNAPAKAFYTDMTESHWAYQSIKFLTEVGVVVGYPDGSYKPDIPVTTKIKKKRHGVLEQHTMAFFLYLRKLIFSHIDIRYRSYCAK